MANEPILNQEEVDALLVGMDEGRVPLADPTGATDVRRYELGREARIVRARMPTLAMLNERYARLYRHSICNILRRSAGVIGGQIRMVQFVDYLQSVRTPSSISLLRFAPLRGTVLLVNAVKGQVVVEGARPLKKAAKPTEANPSGGISTIDGPVHISNVKKVG